MPISKNPTIVVNNFVTSSTTTDHGLLDGLTDDDHTQYILEDGSRAFSGDISHGGNDITSVGFLVSTGVTGAHSEVSSGVPFLLSDGNISLVTASNGQVTISASLGPGVSDHGALTGLSDDDHPQYLLVATHTPISTSIATDINTNQADIATNVTSITTLSGVVATDVNTNQADISTNTTSITTLSGVVATDISNLSFLPNTVDTSGERTLSLADHNTVIEMGHASANVIRVPDTLPISFRSMFIQTTDASIEVLTTGSILYASATFNSASAENGSSIAILSGSTFVHLFGDLETL